MTPQHFVPFPRFDWVVNFFGAQSSNGHLTVGFGWMAMVLYVVYSFISRLI
jgi:hypothetical protein